MIRGDVFIPLLGIPVGLVLGLVVSISTAPATIDLPTFRPPVGATMDDLGITRCLIYGNPVR